MLRVVLDTSVLVSAFRNRDGGSYHLLRLLERGTFMALVSTSLVLEYEAVLKRPEQLEANGLDIEDVDVALRALSALFQPIDIHYRWRPQLNDPNDDMVLEAVVNGHADTLVTFNTADFLPAAPRFGFRLQKPAELLKELLR
ncbi:putative toxin-antitoxin system toxin component, PIN family [Rhizobium sp.]